MIENVLLVWLVSLYDGYSMNRLVKCCLSLGFVGVYLHRLVKLYLANNCDDYVFCDIILIGALHH